MPTHVTVNSLGLTYKGTLGISMATIPDVCKTPSPGGPVPIPYPNIAQQSTLKSGTTTVKAKGKMIAIKGSQYGSSNGDEAGTAGGVKSSVNMKATDWITYSFDVKMDGKNACRHTDKKFHNNQNTVDLGGNFDASKIPDGLSPSEEAAAKECSYIRYKYKGAQKKGNNHRKDERSGLEDKIKDGTASPADIDAFVQIEIERIEFYEEELKGRGDYVARNCDRFEWKGTTKTEEQRRTNHINAIQNRQGQINNMSKLSIL